jgi:hypothetical protein
MRRSAYPPMWSRFSAKAMRGKKQRLYEKYLDVDFYFEIITRSVRLVVASTANRAINLFPLELSEV